MIGFSFLMRLESSFSSWFFTLWFFTLSRKLQLVVADNIGSQDIYLNQKADGAWIGLGIWAIWIRRRHFARVLRQVCEQERAAVDRDEPISYRCAFWRMAAGICLLAAFVYGAGVSLRMFGTSRGMYLLMAVRLTKVRAGLGPAIREVVGRDPLATMLLGSRARVFGPPDLTTLSFLYWLNGENVARAMPSQLEAFRLRKRGGAGNRKLFKSMIVALAAGIPMAFPTNFALLYDHGTTQGFVTSLGRETFNELQRWLQIQTSPDPISLAAMGLGFGFTMFLTAIKMRFSWRPSHLIVYVIGTGTWGDLSFIWVRALPSSAAKSVILNYGGMRA